MTKLKEIHLEWALKHLMRFYDSDFYPKMFEFRAIAHNWEQVKNHLLSLDLDIHIPKSPNIKLAPKPDGNYRIVHQLDPIDSLIYTAQIYEVCETIEDFRIPESENIACSYRIKPDIEGSFFKKRATSDNTFHNRSMELADKYKGGFVIIADITDFYNQIYTHRIQNLVAEAGKGAHNEQATAIEGFLSALNKKTSRGIPVGPTPSIILAELIMADIDNKILYYTRDFVRNVDDIRIFFPDRPQAAFVLHELTLYLYTYHRLVFSGEKTKIRSTKWFLEGYSLDEEKEEKAAMRAKAEELASTKFEELLRNVDPYTYEDECDYEEEYKKILAKIMENGQFELLANTYLELFKKSLQPHKMDFPLLRHLLRKATMYRIRNLVPLVLENFETLLPIIREVVIYLNKVSNEDIVSNFKEEFQSILAAHYVRLPFVNLWLAYLLQNHYFDKLDLPTGYDAILSTRDKALIALVRKDTTWIRSYRDGIDVLGPWDKRAVLYSASVLTSDEMIPWADVVGSGGDIIDKSISSLLISEKKSGK